MSLDLKSLIDNIQQEPSDPSTLVEEEKFVVKKLHDAKDLEDLKTRREYNKLLKQNRKERKRYAKHIFIFTCCWGILIFVTLIANALNSINGHKYFEFQLSDNVLITLITSTTINFFGFFLLVVKYLFHIDKAPERKEEVTNH